MAEQAVDLRAALAVWSRHRVLLGVAGLVGAVAGAGLVQVVHPRYSSTSQVLLPVVSSGSQGDTGRDSATEIKIASSDVVLGPAGRTVSPHLTSTQVSRMVKVQALSNDVIAFRVEAPTPAKAEALAQAVADAEVAYSNGSAGSLVSARNSALLERRKTLQTSLNSVTTEINTTTKRKATEASTSTAGRADDAALAELTAQQADLVLQLDSVKSQLMDGQDTRTASVIERATPATTRSATMRYALYGAGGLLGGIVPAGLLLSLAARRDRRLRSRDEIADALGCSVVASVRARRPRSVSAWGRLLSSYAPDTVDAWALRQILHRVRPTAAGGAASTSKPGPGAVIVVALADDPAALAMAPQLASYAAATGLPTRLVTYGRDESAPGLWAAAGLEAGAEPREGLRVGSPKGDVDLTVVLVVLDRKRPVADDLVAAAAAIPSRTRSTTLVAVSAGSATAQELAHAAVLLDDQGMRIDGVVVADADDLDRTTGRMAVGDQPQTRRLSAVPAAAHRRTAADGGERSR